MKKFESIYIDGFENHINENLITRPFPIMREMEIFAEKNKIPILSPAAGSILKFLIKVYQPQKILELGTGLGYSTAWMLSSEISLEIDTLDRNAKELKSAESFLNQIKAPSQSINLKQSNCVEFLKQTDDLLAYDFIFVDCDKICYPDILNLLLAKVQSEAILLFDNVLWHGRLDETVYTKPSDRAIQEFWYLLKEKGIPYTLFPAGDGLCLIRD